MMSHPKLFDYGIQTERSELRAHVCPVVRRVYVYPTAAGVQALANGIPTLGYQVGVAGPTANGRRVRPFDIRRCIAIECNEEAWTAIGFLEGERTTEKGAKAVRLVCAMIRAGLFPLPIANLVDEKTTQTVQVKGDDVYVWIGNQRVHIQVKCDFRGGDEMRGGTGYLYLQTAERNPLKRI